MNSDGRQPRVLVVADEPTVVTDSQRILESIVCQVLDADLGFDAVALKMMTVEYLSMKLSA